MKITSANITGSFIINGTDVTNTLTTSNTFSSSINTRTTNLEVTSSALTSSLNALSASVYTTSGSVSSTVVSYGTRIGTIESKYATTGSNTFSGNQTITGTITAQTLIVQTVTSSVVYSSGSNTFGNSSGNTQTMYGAVNVIGSVSASAYTGAGTGLTSIPNSALTNNSITVNGVSVALGGTLTQGQVLNGAISGSGQVAIASTSGFGTYINQTLLTTSSPTFAAVSATTFTGALSGNATTATTAGALTSMNISQFTNNSGYLVGSNVHYIGTTSIALNRASGAQTLTGVSIDGNAATVTNGLTTSNYVGYSNFSGQVNAVTPTGYTSGTKAIGGGLPFQAGSISVTQADDTFYPLISCYSVVSGQGYYNYPAFGFMRPTTNINGDVVISNRGDGLGTIYWKFKPNGDLTIAGAFNGSGAGLTGTAASLSIGGNAATATSISGYNNPTTAATANTIVYRDGSGHITGNYVFSSYFNTSGGGAERGTGISYVAGFNSGDYYIRSYTLQGLASAMSGATMNINGVASNANQLTLRTAGASIYDANTADLGVFSNYYGGGQISNIPEGGYGSLYTFGGYSNTSLSLQLYSVINHNSSSPTRTLYFRMGNNLGFGNDWHALIDTSNHTSYSVPLNTNGIYTIGAGSGNAGFVFYASNYGAGYAGRIYGNNGDGNTYFSARNGSSSFTEVGYLAYTGLYMSYYGSYSDITLKNVIETNPDIDLSGIDVIKYTLKDETISHVVRYGYSAQQVQEILPDVVNTNMNIDGSAGILTLNYNDLHTLKIASLEKKVKELQEQLNQLLNK